MKGRVVALLLSLLLAFGAGLYALGRPVRWNDDPATLQSNEQLLKKKPELLVMGPSWPERQALRLGRLLGPGKGISAAVLPAPDHAAFLYAMLENRIYAGGESPRVLVLVASAAGLFSREPATERQRLQLVEEMALEEPVLGPLTVGTQRLDGAGERLREGLARIFEKETIVPSSGPPRLETSLLTALAQLVGHHDGSLVLAIQGHPTLDPEIAAELATQLPSVVLLQLPGTSLTPGTLADRLRETGLFEEKAGHFLAPARIDRLVEQIAGQTPGWRDIVNRLLPPLILPPTAMAGSPCLLDFSYPGADAVQDQATILAGLGAASPLRLYEDDRPLLPNLSRAQVKEDCIGGFLHGKGNLIVAASDTAPHEYRVSLDPDAPTTLEDGRDVWWVYPGTNLRFHFEKPWKDRGSFVVRMDLLVFPANAMNATPELQVGDVVMPFLPEAPGIWSIPIESTPPEGPWDVTVRANPGGPWVAISRFSIGRGEEEVRIIGKEPETIKLFDGKLQWEAAPPTLESTWKPAETIGFFPLPSSLSALSDDQLDAAAGRCSPIRVLQDGTPLRFNHRRLEEVQKTNNAVAHTPEGIYFSATDGKLESHAYTISYAEDRRCNGARWLYPQDHLTITPLPVQLARLSQGAEWLRLAGIVPSGATGSFHLTVMSEDRILLQKDLPVSVLDGQPREWMLPERVLSRTRTKVLISTDTAAILLTTAVLAESPL